MKYNAKFTKIEDGYYRAKINNVELWEVDELLVWTIKEREKEIERLNNRLKTSNDTCYYLRNTIDKAIFFIQNQELHKSKDTTGAITMKERKLIDILLGSDKE